MRQLGIVLYYFADGLWRRKEDNMSIAETIKGIRESTGMNRRQVKHQNTGALNEPMVFITQCDIMNLVG
jgi:hypothetical protein